MNSILGFASILRDERFGSHTDSRYKTFAETIIASGDYLMDSINDLLDLSKAESGLLELEEVPVSIVDQAARAIGVVTGLASQRQIQINNATDPNCPPIRADTRMVRQMMSHLLSNAIKFTPRGGRVTIATELEGDGGVTIVVSDTGIGIPENMIQDVVRPFAQVDQRLSREHRGPGLGLSLCKSIIEQHGGSMSIESELDRGTKAKLRFPAHRTLSPVSSGSPSSSRSA